MRPITITHSAIGGKRKLAQLFPEDSLFSTQFLPSSYMSFPEIVVIHFLLQGGAPILASYDNIWISTVHAISNTSEVHFRSTT